MGGEGDIRSGSGGGFSDFSIEVPEFYNFGFDVIDRWKEREPEKLAMVWVNQHGQEKRFTFGDLSAMSDQAARILLLHGIRRNDRVFIMLPRIPEWWIMIIALIKLGAVHSQRRRCSRPRISGTASIPVEFRMVITDLENAGKVEEISRECPSVALRMLVDGELPGWIGYPGERSSTGPGFISYSGSPRHTEDKGHGPPRDLLHLGHDRGTEDGAP